ncbi:MAG: hypothetical protein JW888_12635 [Pirellulales bacterium]|nr:hypothetical protein [Pirellulales bacterium]
MEARIFARRAAFAAGPTRCVWLLLLVALLFASMGASARSRNFVVNTSDPALAQKIAQAAEKYRHDLAVSWLGKPMPDWSAPCPMTVRVGENLGAGGATTFLFDHGEVFGWRMNIQGSRERLFDSVLPHEITHMVLASHFRRPLPRWADEGAATSTECSAERDKHYRMLKQFLCTGRGIAFNHLFAMTEYPPDVMPLYAEGFSLADYLIQQGGRRRFIAFLEDALKGDQWAAATRRHYGPASLSQLQNQWLAWIRQGHPDLQPQRTTSPETESKTLLASASGDANAPAPTRSVRPPSRQLAVAGRRAWPEPNLIHRIPRNTPAAENVVLADRLVPVVFPDSRGKTPAAAWQPPPDAASTTTHAQTARPQPVEQAQQIILEWGKPGAAVAAPPAGQAGLWR